MTDLFPSSCEVLVIGSGAGGAPTAALLDPLALLGDHDVEPGLREQAARVSGHVSHT